MKKTLCTWMLLLFVFSATSAWSQVTAQVEGTVTDGGKPLPSAAVTLTSLTTGKTYKFKTDKSGNFLAVGVAYGDYEAQVSNSNGENIYKQKVSVAPSENSAVATIKIDVSAVKSGGAQSSQPQTSQPQGSQSTPGSSGAQQQGQQPKYTKEQIEELKKQNEKAQNVNVLIKQANTAITAKNWQDAISPLQQLVALEPNNWQYYSGLGDAELNVGQYEQAAETYDKGIQAAENNTAVNPHDASTDPAKKKAGIAKMLTNEGNAYLKLHKNNEAVAAYTKAASMDPNPATAYFNLCATQYNTGNTEGALGACDKAIAADPTKADAYFIKGSLMIGQSKLDNAGKMQAPPGTAEALNKYLELAPDGPHANDVKQMLEAIGSKVETTYKKKEK